LIIASARIDKDKLNFYERIDQPINMTSMPALYWLFGFWVGLSGRDVSLGEIHEGDFARTIELGGGRPNRSALRDAGMQNRGGLPSLRETVFLQEMAAHGAADRRTP